MSLNFNSLLKGVSRSFYLSLRIIPASLRLPMGVGYLMCWIADTVSDTDSLPLQDRRPTLGVYKSLFEHFPITKDGFKEFENKINNVAEKQNFHPMLVPALKFGPTQFFKLSRTEQALVQEVVLSVIQGMEMDLTHFGDSPENVQALKDNNDFETYLDRIGGGPGRFWSKLCLTQYTFVPTLDQKKWVQDGIEFGKGLQMVNILRDLPQDLQRGRCYIPQSELNTWGFKVQNLLNGDVSQFAPLYHKLIDQNIKRLQTGVSYLDLIPKKDFGLRAAVWWPLNIGLKTLIRLRSSQTILRADGIHKISRRDVYKTMAWSVFLLQFKKLMRWDFEDLAKEARSSSNLS